MFRKPNYTQVPNEFFDEMLPTLKEGELRILIVIMRQTFGWGNKEWDRISISQLMKKSGMERMAVVRATKSLVEKKLVIKHKEGVKGQENSWYSLCVESEAEFINPIDNSNNSYQYPKDTPPSILKIPTKETITKEKKREEAQAPIALQIFSYKRIRMTNGEFEKLTKDLGQDPVCHMMDRLDEYADINPKRFKQYASHPAVIRKWIREDKAKEKAIRADKPWNNKVNAVTQGVGDQTLQETEANNRSWAAQSRREFFDAIKADKIRELGNGWEFSRGGQGAVSILVEFKDPDFIVYCEELIDQMGITRPE